MILLYHPQVLSVWCHIRGATGTWKTGVMNYNHWRFLHCRWIHSVYSNVLLQQMLQRISSTQGGGLKHAKKQMCACGQERKDSAHQTIQLQTLVWFYLSILSANRRHLQTKHKDINHRHTQADASDTSQPSARLLYIRSVNQTCGKNVWILPVLTGWFTVSAAGFYISLDLKYLWETSSVPVR